MEAFLFLELQSALKDLILLLHILHHSSHSFLASIEIIDFGEQSRLWDLVGVDIGLIELCSIFIVLSSKVLVIEQIWENWLWHQIKILSHIEQALSPVILVKIETHVFEFPGGFDNADPGVESFIVHQVFMLGPSRFRALRWNKWAAKVVASDELV